MSNCRRANAKGGTYLFAVVTYRRQEPCRVGIAYPSFGFVFNRHARQRTRRAGNATNQMCWRLIIDYAELSKG